MARRYLLAIAGLALVLHIVAMARTPLPAQDGLKFIRVAKQFQTHRFDEVVQGSDQHPLYSACIAVTQPVARLFTGSGPTSWRVAAQSVSVIAALLTLIPLYRLAHALFGEKPALLAALIYVLLPLPASVGHDTLSDSLALLFFTSSLCLGEAALRTDRTRAWIACGFIAGLGYLTRPEILIVPTAVVLTGLSRLFGRLELVSIRQQITKVGGLGIATLAIVGCYAMVKGEVSEKLSLRIGASLGSSSRAQKTTARVALPKGLDSPEWNFAAKEESGDREIQGSMRKTFLKLVQEWGSGLSWIMVPMLGFGLFVGSKRLDGSQIGRWLIGVYVILFVAVVVRHATSFGYLSSRHALTLVVATVPCVGAGLYTWATGFPARRGLNPLQAKRLATLGLCGLIALGTGAQVKGQHHSRSGHMDAGEWLRDHASATDAVLDTRGWASFVRDGKSYDYWHVRQALNDSSLHFIVVGTDELKADSPRASTLRALLAYAGSTAAEFPDRPGSKHIAVKIYEYHQPISWKGMTH
jgi:hypothetical protein